MVLTEADGFFCFKMANAPDTAGVANDAPLPVPVPPPGRDDTTDSPGAIRLRREDLSENDDTASESFVEPTLTALEMHAGDSSALICAYTSLLVLFYFVKREREESSSRYKTPALR